MSEVFLSYARDDGEGRAANLRERLAREASDIVIKQDRLFLEGGVGWWKQITDAIDSVEFLVLLMTPKALASGNVQKEWRYARQQGVCVYPVKGAPDAELQFEKMARWMSKAHFYDLDKEWPTFLAHLRKGCDTPRVPFMAPDLPAHFTERPVEFEALKNLLLTPDRSQPIAITTAIAGAGGFGKTTLAAALCHDEDVVANFDDGILWVTLGQTPNISGSLLTLYAALSGERPGFTSVEEAAYQLGEKLEERNCLIVIDDVWDQEHLRPFLRGGKSGARLFTTRDTSIASAGRPVKVDRMREMEATSMLGKGVENLAASEAIELSRRLGEWPLALELASAMIRERVRQGDSATRAAERLSTLIERKGVGALQDPTAERRHRTISSVLEVSLDQLDADDRRRLAELSIFPEDVEIPLGAAASVWELDEFESEESAQRLARLSLLKLDLQHGVLSLHDVMRSWLATALTSATDIHNRLVNSWPDWRKLPDLPGKYAWRWLPWHLVKAERKEDLERILWDPLWTSAKLAATEVNVLIADYDHLKPSTNVELLQGALRLSSNTLAVDPAQFASQMTGRLLIYRTTPAIERFVGEMVDVAPQCWLRPLHPGLHPPGTELLRTLEGHSSGVCAVAVTPEGKRAVSASYDNTLKVWDLESGRVLRTLEGHSAIYGVALTPDGKRAVSAASDNTLKVWDLESGCALHTLEGHSKFVSGVAVTPEGKRAVSASSDNTLKVWDLESGRMLRTLEGHSASVSGVAVTPEGKRAVSAAWDNTLKVWDLESGRVLRTLEGHSNLVSSVAVTPEGTRAVSASYDNTLKVWDLESGCALRPLEGHSLGVSGVAVTPEGKRAVSASWDGTLKVWDLECGRASHTLEGHSASVSAVAVMPEGARAVSASWDNMLKVWDLETARPLLGLEGHSHFVNDAAVTPDGKRAVSASYDNTLKVWDLESGRQLRTLEGHSKFVSGVAVTPDGRRAVSAAWDNTLKVWDLESGRQLRTLEGHSKFVSGVAVTPDGRRAVSAAWDNTLKVWDLESGHVLRTLEGHSASVCGVAVTPDGTRAVSASWDKTLKVWDLESGRELRTLEGHSYWVHGVDVMPDGRRAVSASWDKTLKVWDLESGRALRTLEGHSKSVSGVAVTPDGRRAVSAAWDNTLKVWDLESGLVLATFTCDAGVTCCAWISRHRIIAGDNRGRMHFLQLEQQLDVTVTA
jgi:WD40 repeat protein